MRIPLLVRNVSPTDELSCDDPAEVDFASGCYRIEYRIDAGATVDYQRPIVIDEVGLHTFEFRSVDGAANEEEFRSI